jgi:hypothetical protein
MGDERDDRSGPTTDGFTENILRDATTTGTGDEQEPPDQPQGAGFPRRGDELDDEDRSTRG